jgi:uncharacterized protein
MRRGIITILIGALVILGIIIYFAWLWPSLPTFSSKPPVSSFPTTLGQSTLPMETITVGGVSIQVEVASDDAEREAGLSGRAGLPPGQGMLFVFPEPASDGFWMKEMNFPLDIIYAKADGTIVTIWPDLSPSTYPQAFYPVSPVQYVLEVPANFAAQNSIVVGSKIVL